MSHELNEPSELFKIWRNPGDEAESPRYLGEFLPPSGGLLFTVDDIIELGFPPGTYPH